MHSKQDPFREAREQSGVQITEFNGGNIPFILRLKELRKVVKDWQNFSSDHPALGRNPSFYATDSD